MKSSHVSLSLFDKLGRDGLRYLGAQALEARRRAKLPLSVSLSKKTTSSVGEILLEALSSGAPRLSGRG